MSRTSGFRRVPASYRPCDRRHSLVGESAETGLNDFGRPQWHPLEDGEKPSLAILASVGEIDPLGTRKDGLDAFLDQKLEEGYVIETRTDTHAIIVRRPKGLKRFTSGADPGRYVVEVDDDGIAKMRPAEPRRA
jgi:hypothetical protein